MIISKTPFRVSFAGGGTDLKAFYSGEEGAVLSTSIDKYMYIAMHKSFEDKILLKYSKTEHVASVAEIQHPLIKECFLNSDFRENVEITSIADIPSSGTGLGSSSAFTISLLKSIYTYKRQDRTNVSLAKEACDIEINRLKEPIGKQDQYACAVGGLNLIRFKSDEEVVIEPITVKNDVKQELQDNLLLLYTGITRNASSVLLEQTKETSKEDKFQNLIKMRDLAYELRDSLISGDISSFGDTLHKGWTLKKNMTSSISNPVIDRYYSAAMKQGALGGKILGAGGGGFLLFYCEKNKQANLIRSLKLRQMPFRFDPQGSRMIYMEDDPNE